MSNQDNNRTIPVFPPSGKKGLGFLVILGAGESGVGAAILGKQKGYTVLVPIKEVLQKNTKKFF